jgi:hypothetical protein
MSNSTTIIILRLLKHLPVVMLSVAKRSRNMYSIVSKTPFDFAQGDCLRGFSDVSSNKQTFFTVYNNLRTYIDNVLLH